MTIRLLSGLYVFFTKKKGDMNMMRRRILWTVLVVLIALLCLNTVVAARVQITVASDTVGKSYELALEAAQMYEEKTQV